MAKGHVFSSDKDTAVHDDSLPESALAPVQGNASEDCTPESPLIKVPALADLLGFSEQVEPSESSEQAVSASAEVSATSGVESPVVPVSDVHGPEASASFFSSRALAVYALTVCLLALLESGRLQTFLEQTEVPGAEQAAVLLHEAARLSGATLVSNAETRLTRQLATDTVIGGTAPATEATGTAGISGTLADRIASLPAAPRRAFVPPQAVATTPAKPKAFVPQVRQSATPAVLIVGDSLIMEGLGPALHRTLRKRTDINVVREGRYSTGLTRADTFNWPDRMRELVALHDPDIILVCLGANDSQDILVEGKRHIAGTPSWQTLYRERADRFLAAATARGATVIWLGLPIMGKPAYEKRIRLLSDLQEAACTDEPLCGFQNGVPALADAAGNYLAFLVDEKGQHVRLRYKDMVHVTEQGGQRLVDRAMPRIEQGIADVKAGVAFEATPVPSAPATPPSAGDSAQPSEKSVQPATDVPTPAPAPNPDAWDALLK